MKTYVSIGSFDDEYGGLVLLDAGKERRHAAAMFLGRVQQFRLVHGDPYGQPGPQGQQLIIF